MTCDGLASRPGGVEILLAASCYGNRDKLRQHKPVLASRLHLLLELQPESILIVLRLFQIALMLSGVSESLRPIPRKCVILGNDALKIHTVETRLFEHPDSYKTSFLSSGEGTSLTRTANAETYEPKGFGKT